MDALLTEMSSTFNQNSEEEPQINLTEDNTLKWRGLHNNSYASSKRRTRKSAKIDESVADDRQNSSSASTTATETTEPTAEGVASTASSRGGGEGQTMPPPANNPTETKAATTVAKSERVLRRTRTSSEVGTAVAVESKKANNVQEKSSTASNGSTNSTNMKQGTNRAVNVVVSTKSNKDKEQPPATTLSASKDNSDEELLQQQQKLNDDKAITTATTITTDPVVPENHPTPIVATSTTESGNGMENVDATNGDSQGLIETRSSKRVTRRRGSTGREEMYLKRKAPVEEKQSSNSGTSEKKPIGTGQDSSNDVSSSVEDGQTSLTTTSEEKKPRLLMKIRTDNKNISIVKPVENSEEPIEVDGVKEPEQKTENESSETINNGAAEPKRRGRKPGSSLKNKYAEKLKILPKRTGVRGQVSPEQSPQAVSQQRPSRRIKPTAKILENEELRHGFEQQNSARLLGMNASEYESKKASVLNVSKASQKLGHLIHLDGQVEQLNVDNIYSTSNRPCPEPEDFLNELKNSKNGGESNNAQSEEKQEEKLNKKQQKLKERHFQQLGLRKTSRSDTNSEPDEVNEQSNGPFRAPQPQNHHLKTNGNAERLPSTSVGSQQYQRQRNSTAEKGDSHLLFSDDLQVRRKVQTNSVAREKFICLCTQMSEFYSHNKTAKSLYCSAVDQIRAERVGCCNDIAGNQLNLQRPSARVSFMVLCQSHKNRFHSHHCCPVCGVFCTEGQFMLCPRNHLFHRECVVRSSSAAPGSVKRSVGAVKCPHCGVDVAETEVDLYMECSNELTYYPNQEGFIKTARISLSNGLVAVPHNPMANGKLEFNIDKLIPESVQNVRDRYRQRRGAHRSGSEAEFTSHEFFFAVSNDDIEKVAEIIASGFDVSAPSKEFHHGTCLHLIAHFGSLNMLYLILSRVASVDFINAQDKELRTAAMCAVVGEKHEILRLLVQCGADVARKGPDGMTALHLAAKVGNLIATQIILEHYRKKVTFQKFEAFINAVDDGQWTALVWAAENGLNEIESYLIALGASPNICDSENNSSLHWAALSNNVETILPLLESNCDFNLQNVNGDTALHIACRHGNAHMCLIFIAHGSDLQIKNLADEMPLDCVPDPNGTCAKLLKYNISLKAIAGGRNRSVVLNNDISMGRESYPVKLVSADKNVTLPNFKYVTQAIIVHNTIHIDRRISEMRICACPDNCTSESCQCSEISSQNWYDANGRLSNEFNFDDPSMIYECNDVCGCHKLLCKNRVVQNGSKVSLQVERSSKRGKGWSARSISRIPKGSFVSEYTGEILTNGEADQRMDDSYFFDLGGSEHCIDAKFYGNVSRFFNHSCSPNVVPIKVYFGHQDFRFPKIAFFASENIEANQEITFDYGDKFWMVKHKFFTCQCEAPNCRYSTQMIAKTLEEMNQRSQPITIT